MAFNWRNSGWLYDALFLLLHAAYATICLKRYHLCTYPLNIWLVVDYAIIYALHVLVAVDLELAMGSGFLNFSYARACVRAAIIVFPAYILPLWLFVDHHWDGWTLWFTKAEDCSSEPGDIATFGFVLGAVCFWFGLVHFICRLKMRRREDAASYHPGLTAADHKMLEKYIQQVPRFRLTATDYSECLFCLEEFVIGDEVRGLPCAHNFHVDCIDPWLRLKFRCPRCRSSFLSNPKPQPTVDSSSSASPQ